MPSGNKVSTLPRLSILPVLGVTWGSPGAYAATLDIDSPASPTRRMVLASLLFVRAGVSGGRHELDGAVPGTAGNDIQSARDVADQYKPSVGNRRPIGEEDDDALFRLEIRDVARAVAAHLGGVDVEWRRQLRELGGAHPICERQDERELHRELRRRSGIVESDNGDRRSVCDGG